jgi:hypothetical protein
MCSIFVYRFYVRYLQFILVLVLLLKEIMMSTDTALSRVLNYVAIRTSQQHKRTLFILVFH